MRLANDAAEAMLELLPLELGILQQEVARLALLADEDGTISAELVQQQVGGWRTRATWDMIDAVADGNAADAISQLARLLSAGEHPIGLLAQLSSTLRRFALATELIEASEAEGKSLGVRQALETAGVPAFKLGVAERQLRQLGRQRARQLPGWLLAVDLALKGHNSQEAKARIELERLIVRLSTAGDARRPAGQPMAMR